MRDPKPPHPPKTPPMQDPATGPAELPAPPPPPGAAPETPPPGAQPDPPRPPSGEQWGPTARPVATQPAPEGPRWLDAPPPTEAPPWLDPPPADEPPPWLDAPPPDEAPPWLDALPAEEVLQPPEGSNAPPAETAPQDPGRLDEDGAPGSPAPRPPQDADPSPAALGGAADQTGDAQPGEEGPPPQAAGGGAWTQGPATRRFLSPQGLAEAAAPSALPPDGWRLARELAALAPAQAEGLSLLAAVALLDLNRGSTQSPVTGTSGQAHLQSSLHDLLGRGPSEAELAALMTLLRRGAPPVLSPTPAPTPLLVDGGALYLYRHHRLEVEVAAQLAARAGARSPQPGLQSAQAEVLAASQPPLSPSQVEALSAALGRPLSVISGGPGTGKTFLVTALLRVLIRLGVELPRIAIAAPTGKAANRLKQALTAGLQALPDAGPDRPLRSQPPSPETIHRLLGVLPNGGFLHHADNPLLCRVLIVDESSMVDLELMRALLVALPPDAQLILLGDVDQLPSVEAGAILADLSASPALAPAVLRLRENHRMRPDDPDGAEILGAAQQLQRGEARPLASVPPRASVDALRWRGVERLGSAAREQTLDAWAAGSLAGQVPIQDLQHSLRFDAGGVLAEQAAQLRDWLEASQRDKLLTITRAVALDTSADAVNAAIHARLRRRWPSSWAERFLPGEPVMMTRNDYERGLYNGDQGLILNVQLGHAPPERAAVFPGPEGPQAFALGGLISALSLAHAITVHKAQGSEYERVLLLLPDQELPILSRELVYTALTRARRGVVILGDDPVLQAGVARRSARFSGLTARIQAALAPS